MLVIGPDNGSKRCINGSEQYLVVSVFPEFIQIMLASLRPGTSKSNQLALANPTQVTSKTIH